MNKIICVAHDGSESQFEWGKVKGVYPIPDSEGIIVDEFIIRPVENQSSGTFNIMVLERENDVKILSQSRTRDNPFVKGKRITAGMLPIIFESYGKKRIISSSVLQPDFPGEARSPDMEKVYLDLFGRGMISKDRQKDLYYYDERDHEINQGR